MRRAERAITDPSHLLRILAEAEVGHLGLVDDEGVYVVPLSYAHRVGPDGGVTVYVHGAGEGRKVAAIRERPDARLCFEVELRHATFGVDSPEVCDIGVWFESVISWGKARIVSDATEARDALGLIVDKYAFPRSSELPATLGPWVTILALDLVEMSGKERRPGQ